MSRWAKYYHQTDFLGRGLSDSQHEKCGMRGSSCLCFLFVPVWVRRERDKRKRYFYLGRITEHQRTIVSCGDYWLFWSTVICTPFGIIQILIWISNNIKTFKKSQCSFIHFSSYSNTQYCILIDLLTRLYSHGSGELLKVLKLDL